MVDKAAQSNINVSQQNFLQKTAQKKEQTKEAESKALTKTAEKDAFAKAQTFEHDYVDYQMPHSIRTLNRNMSSYLSRVQAVRHFDASAKDKFHMLQESEQEAANLAPPAAAPAQKAKAKAQTLEEKLKQIPEEHRDNPLVLRYLQNSRGETKFDYEINDRGQEVPVLVHIPHGSKSAKPLKTYL